MDQNDFHQILSHLDYNKDSRISINDFIAASMDIQTILTKNKIDGIFKEFDISGRGNISGEDIKITFSKFGKIVSDEEVEVIMGKYDTDGDYHLSLDEFKSIFALHKSERDQSRKEVEEEGQGGKFDET